MMRLRTLTGLDASYVKVCLANSGIKARVRRFPGSIRIVFEGAWEAVAEVLNSEGYRHASGCEFGRFQFEGNQVFVRYMAG